MLISPLESRTKGLYPVSIGTSIALEALLGTSKDHPHQKTYHLIGAVTVAYVLMFEHYLEI